ncbi:hypothetical protein [Halorussus salinus]|nr:hypothetical protein [Halorussus salinus]
MLTNTLADDRRRHGNPAYRPTTAGPVPVTDDRPTPSSAGVARRRPR